MFNGILATYRRYRRYLETIHSIGGVISIITNDLKLTCTDNKTQTCLNPTDRNLVMTLVCDVEDMEKCLTQSDENCVLEFDILFI